MKNASSRRIQTWLCIAVTVAAVAAIGCSQAGDDLGNARKASDEGDRTRAITLYEDHLRTNPDDFDARLEYTLVLGENWAARGGDRRPLLDNLAMLYEARPDNRRVREFYGMMLIREGQAAFEDRRFDEAEERFDQSLEVNPEVGTASYHLGRLYDEWGRPDDAFRAWVAAAVKRPPIPDLYLSLGNAYIERDDLDRAINTLGLVVELSGMSTYLIPSAHCSMARAYALRGDREEARDHLEQAGENCDPGVSLQAGTQR